MTGAWPERQLRHAVQLDARVVRARGQTVSTRVLDLSLDGCKLDTELAIGERVEVTIQRIGLLLAVVRWSLSGQSGAHFVSRTGDGDC